MAIYDPFRQGYMHDWRLEEPVKEGVHQAFSGSQSSFDDERLLRVLQALAFQAEMAREEAEFAQSLRMLLQERLEEEKDLFGWW